MVDRCIREFARLEPLEPRQFLSAGELDPAFGQRGAAILTQFGTGSEVDVRDDGKIVIAAGSQLLRLNPIGSLDRSFGDNGSVATGLDFAHTAFMPDGRIVVSGQKPLSTGGGEIRIARYKPDGSVDTSFNNAGFAVIPSDFRYSDIALQPDGKILLATESFLSEEPAAPASPLILLARFNADDGALDRSFGDDGYARGAFGTVFGSRGPSDIFVLRSGDIHVVGSSSRKGGGTEAISDAFDSTGHYLGSPYYHGMDSQFNAGAVRGDGRVVTLGNIEVSSDDYIPGQPPAFVSVNGQDKPLDFNPAGGDTSVPTSAVPVPGSQDQIYVAGFEYGGAMGVMRLNGDGSPDESFGHGGVASLRPKKTWQRMSAYALDVAPDGDVILVGNITRKGGAPALTVLRFKGGANEPSEQPPLAALIPINFDYPHGFIQPTAGQPRFEFTMQYAADDQIDISSLGDANILVTGPNGYRQRAKVRRLIRRLSRPPPGRHHLFHPRPRRLMGLGRQRPLSRPGAKAQRLRQPQPARPRGTGRRLPRQAWRLSNEPLLRRPAKRRNPHRQNHQASRPCLSLARIRSFCADSISSGQDSTPIAGTDRAIRSQAGDSRLSGQTRGPSCHRYAAPRARRPF
jgi:uncharacterized delta-60 repeat protein